MPIQDFLVDETSLVYAAAEECGILKILVNFVGLFICLILCSSCDMFCVPVVLEAVDLPESLTGVCVSRPLPLIHETYSENFFFVAWVLDVFVCSLSAVDRCLLIFLVWQMELAGRT
ncbi:hypothetical protein M758_UG068600 [Ceratodon purpureus]|nr:hypothetical protein M758_UG068600 [Ceratodon purpureus]